MSKSLQGNYFGGQAFEAISDPMMLRRMTLVR